jgi:hypothetical protein
MILVFTAIPKLGAQIINKTPLSDRQTFYRIDAELDISAKIVKGNMLAWWVNKSPDFVSDVRLHMYLNAFRNSGSTFNRESGSPGPYDQASKGWVDITSMTDQKGMDLTKNMKFISPDDGNTDDMTVLKVDLYKPARPGDTVFLNIQFESKLPSTIVRTGYSGDYYFVAQWFPKFGVYEPAGMRYSLKGEWNCHQFHNNSEFYSNHSVYEVNITLPENYISGSCGLLISESKDGSGKKTLNYRAEDIVDFAWTAWPGYAVYNDTWKQVKIMLLLPPERKDQVERQFGAIKNALEYFEANVGQYPWPYVTIVDPPFIGGGAGGMEYTTMFTSDSFTGIPGFIHLPETVTIHEFGHAYFMGIMASNEFEEPWLDEGVNSFWEARIMDHYYGANSGFINHPWLKVSDKSLARVSYTSSQSRQATSNAEYSWNYPHDTYSMMSYNKASVILQTLMGIIGEDTMNEVFREYYRKWAFKHPSGKDFIAVVNEVVAKRHGNRFGADMNWFFDETIYGTGICDYKVIGFSNRKIIVDSAKLPDADSVKNIVSQSDTNYIATAELERVGDVVLPVEVLIKFEGGEEVKEIWDGKERTKDFTYQGKGKIVWVKIDPEYKIKMDVNQVNNSRTISPDKIPVKRMTGKAITYLQFLINLLAV